MNAFWRNSCCASSMIQTFGAKSGGDSVVSPIPFVERITFRFDEHRHSLSGRRSGSSPRGVVALATAQGPLAGFVRRLRADWARTLSAAGPGTFLRTLASHFALGLFCGSDKRSTPSPHGGGWEGRCFLWGEGNLQKNNQWVGKEERECTRGTHSFPSALFFCLLFNICAVSVAIFSSPFPSSHRRSFTKERAKEKKERTNAREKRHMKRKRTRGKEMRAIERSNGFSLSLPHFLPYQKSFSVFSSSYKRDSFFRAVYGLAGR